MSEKTPVPLKMEEEKYNIKRISFFLFLLSFLASAWCFSIGSWNQVSRYDAIFSFVEEPAPKDPIRIIYPSVSTTISPTKKGASIQEIFPNIRATSTPIKRRGRSFLGSLSIFPSTILTNGPTGLRMTSGTIWRTVTSSTFFPVSSLQHLPRYSSFFPCFY